MTYQPPVVLSCRDGALSTREGRRSIERAMVTVAYRLESSPATWTVDVSSGAVTMRDCTIGEVEAALAGQATDSLFEISTTARRNSSA